jgi:hypothetical protein
MGGNLLKVDNGFLGRKITTIRQSMRISLSAADMPTHTAMKKNTP